MITRIVDPRKNIDSNITISRLILIDLLFQDHH